MVIENLTWLLEKVSEYAFASFSSWASFTTAMGKVAGSLTDFDSPLAWPYLLASLAIAGGVFVCAGKKDVARPRSFGAFLLPRHVYLHSSAILDYKFYASNLFLTFLFWVPIIIGINIVGYKLMSAVIIKFLSWEPPATLSTGQALGAAFGLFVLHDFINYWAHVLLHKSPALWAFHRVHHSAEVLTPFTAFRAHPIELFFPALLQMPVIGLAAVFFQNVPARDMGVTTICGIGLFTFITGLFGHQLRHSHVWLSFGPVLSRLYISPAQHQIHHSTDRRHLDKNFGVRFAVWDAMFGTLYVPKERETLNVGLPNADLREFKTVTQLYVLPFARALREGKKAALPLGRYKDSHANSMSEGPSGTCSPDRAHGDGDLRGRPVSFRAAGKWVALVPRNSVTRDF